MAKTPATPFSESSVVALEEKDVADWGGLFIDIVDLEAGFKEDNFTIQSPCPLLRDAFYASQDWFCAQMNELWADCHLEDNETPFEAIAKLSFQALDRCLLQAKLVERLRDNLDGISDAAQMRLESRTEFCEHFGLPISQEDNVFTIYVMHKSQCKVYLPLTFMNPDVLMANVQPTETLSAAQNYRFQ